MEALPWRRTSPLKAGRRGRTTRELHDRTGAGTTGYPAAGLLQTAPILIAVITGYRTMEGVQYLVEIRKRSRAAAAAGTASPN